MKTKSLFKALPQEDQQKVIDLCNQHTYPDVVAILVQPRPEGLQIETSLPLGKPSPAMTVQHDYPRCR